MATKTKKAQSEPILTGVIAVLHREDRFQKLSDGWIRDLALGLDWGPSSEKMMDFKEAEAHCAAAGGRLPTIDELRLIIDYGKFRPAVNPIFADTKTDDWYWSSPPYKNPSWPSYAWCVDFSSGYVYYNHKDLDGYVRPVRASQ